MDNTYNVHNEEENNSLNININYVRPIFHRRVLANMIDFFIFAFLWLISFTIAGNIAKSTNSYKEKQNYINTIHLNSDLYKIDNTGKIYSVISYYNHYQLNTTTQEKNKLREHIDNFIVFISNEYGEESKEEIQKMYDDFRLNDNMKEDGIPYFIISDNKIIENNNSENNNITPTDYVNIYTNFIDNTCNGYLLSIDKTLYEYTSFLSKTIIFWELIPTFFFSGILTWLVPPLVFKRGRKTIGKLIYKISAVNSKYLNLSIGKTFARFSIFFFGIITLSFVTLGVPMIISFSMMAFSKQKQSFPDYMLGIYEVNTSEDKVYFSKEEIISEYLNKDNSAEEFKMIDRL